MILPPIAAIGAWNMCGGSASGALFRGIHPCAPRQPRLLPSPGRQYLAGGKNFDAEHATFGIHIDDEGAVLLLTVDLSAAEKDVGGVRLGIVGHVYHRVRLAFFSNSTVTENVTWVVMTTPVKMHQGVFDGIKNRDTNKPYNARPVQTLRPRVKATQ
jgi:hypothetical protein